MTDARTDRIAREAARLMQAGRAAEIGAAIRQAAGALGLSGAPLPGAGRVRKHAQAMSMQRLGDGAYDQSRLAMWHTAEELMTTLEEALPDTTTLLMGRAAQGHIDAGLTIHVRLHTQASLADIAAALVEHGYDEPAFQTAHTRRGRLGQVRLTEAGHDLILTRCVPGMRVHSGLDVFTGRPVASLDLKALRRRLA